MEQAVQVMAEEELRIVGCRDCLYDTHTCKGCATPVSHDEGRCCAGCADCKHEIMRSSCADCRGLKETDPHEGLLIARFGVSARYKARCACCPDHKIAIGDTIARASEEEGSGFKDFGWVCPECTHVIAYPEHR
jgi:hypothetical protein